MTLYYLKYNSYYNRIVKFENSLPDYMTYSVTTASNIDFNPNNDTETELIVDAYFDNSTPDYLVVADSSDIVSRWFIIEAIRTRSGQYKIVLKRDVIVDWYDQILDSPFLAERCTISENDPYIYKDEGLGFNQIKKSTRLLRDTTATPWYVGYIANDLGDNEGRTISITRPGAILGATEYGTFNDIPDAVRPFIKGISGHTGTNKAVYTDLVNFEVSAQLINYPAVSPAVTYKVKNNSVLYASDIKSGVYYKTRVDVESYSDNTVTAKNEAGKKIANRLYLGQNDLTNSLLTVNGYSKTTGFDQYNDEYIYIIDTDKYYKLKVYKGSSSERRQAITGAAKNIYQTYITSNSIPPSSFGDSGQDGIFWNFTVTNYYVQATEVKTSQAEFTISNTRNRLEDAPYSMFAVPAEFTKLYVDENTSYGNNSEIAKKTVNTIINELQVAQGGTGFIYDVQLLPYCPLRNLRTLTGEFTVNGLTEHVDYDWVEDSDNKLSIIVYPNESSFKFSIKTDVKVTNKKVQSNTEFYRICSPNYSGVFEINAAKNDGIPYIDVKCTYKPFSPYIHLAPQFGGLYGDSSFTYEQRGLICGGNFSIPIISDAWKQYEINNKNYQVAFDRQITSLDVSRDIERQRQEWSMYAGVASAVTSGATSGALIGGTVGGPIGLGIGSAIGGIAAGITSFVGGTQDIKLAERAYAEQKSYQKDIFNAQIGNIKALPNSLVNIGAQCIDNPVFPFLEYYQATDEEISQFVEYLYWNGMSAGKIGTLRGFLVQDKSFIKGSLLRVNDIEEDAHILNTIIYELSQGVFI